MAGTHILTADDRIQQLFSAAFDTPRDARSSEYKEGVRAVLTYRVKGERMRCPYQPGTAQADAYYAGVNEGHHIWRAHREAEASRGKYRSLEGNGA